MKKIQKDFDSIPQVSIVEKANKFYPVIFFNKSIIYTLYKWYYFVYYWKLLNKFSES